jgi:tetratricopeptide (TPR) repeat protein
MRTVVRLIKEGHYRSAIVLLEPYRTKDDFLTQHAIGVAYVRVGRNQEAYEALLHAHRLNPTVAAPLLPAALACARMAKQCDDYRSLALEYRALGGKFTRLADKIANYLPITLTFSRRS